MLFLPLSRTSRVIFADTRHFYPVASRSRVIPCHPDMPYRHFRSLASCSLAISRSRVILCHPDIPYRHFRSIASRSLAISRSRATPARHFRVLDNARKTLRGHLFSHFLLLYTTGDKRTS
jgi:hypothetical protein